MILLQGRDQILTTTDVISSSAFVGVCRGEVWEQNLLEDFFCLYLQCLQLGDRLVYLFASLQILEINEK